MKCIFNPDGTMFLNAKDNHADIDGKTSVIIPDDLNIRKTVPDNKGNVGIVELTFDELQIKLEEYMSNYVNARKLAYPSITDQLDLLYHGGYDVWKESIKSIKDQYPKV